AALNREVSRQAAFLMRRVQSADASNTMMDVAERFDLCCRLSDAERGFVQGVIDFVQTQTTTRMNLAMERLALLSAVVLPITAVASIYGMNIIVSDQTQPIELVFVLATMAVISGLMLWWARRQGWW